jgi:PAS domain-containing protein
MVARTVKPPKSHSPPPAMTLWLSPLRGVAARLRRWFIEPHLSIKDAQQQRHARFLSTFTLSLLAIHILCTATLMVVGSFPHIVFEMQFFAVSGFAIYGLSRTRAYRVAVGALIGNTFAFVIIMIILAPSAHTAVLALFPVFLASFFYDLKRVIIILIVSFAVVITATQTIPGDWRDVWLTLVFLAGASSIAIIGSWLLRTSEARLHERSQQLADSDSRFRAALDGSSQQFYILKAATPRADLTIIEANRMACEHIGVSHQHVLGRAFHPSLLPPGCGDVMIAACHTALSTLTTISATVQTAQNLAFEYVVVPFGECVALSFNDVTERKRAEQRTIELALERERVALYQQAIGDVSHDMMSPLSVVNTSLYLLRQSSDPERHKTQLATLESQVKRLQGMIRELGTLTDTEKLSTANLKMTSRSWSPNSARSMKWWRRNVDAS